MFFALERAITNIRPNIPLDHACSVCSAPASAHHHYGAVVCYPCRAFFRRGTTKEFTCATGNCPVDKSVKNRCRGCRYAKCLDVGMRPELVDATLLRKSLEPRRKPARKSSSAGAVANTAEAIFTSFLQSKGTGSENSPLDLSKAAGDAEGPGDEENGESATTQMFYVFNPPTQTYEPVTIISLGEDGEEETVVVEHTTHLMEDMDEQQESILPNMQDEEEEVEQDDKLFNVGMLGAFKQELVEGFEQNVEREEIVSDSVPISSEEIV